MHDVGELLAHATGRLGDRDRVAGVGLVGCARREPDAGDVGVLEHGVEVGGRARDVEVTEVRRPRPVEVAVLGRAAEVGVDDDHRHPGLGERRREVHHGDRLALGGTRRGDEQRPQRAPLGADGGGGTPSAGGLRARRSSGWRCHIASSDVRNDRYASAVSDAGSAAVDTTNRSARFIFTTGISAITGIRAAPSVPATSRIRAPSSSITISRTRPASRPIPPPTTSRCDDDNVLPPGARMIVSRSGDAASSVVSAGSPAPAIWFCEDLLVQVVDAVAGPRPRRDCSEASGVGVAGGRRRPARRGSTPRASRAAGRDASRAVLLA